MQWGIPVSRWMFAWCAFVAVFVTCLEWLVTQHFPSLNFIAIVFGGTLILTIASNAVDYVRKMGQHVKETHDSVEKLRRRLDLLEINIQTIKSLISARQSSRFDEIHVVDEPNK